MKNKSLLEQFMKENGIWYDIPFWSKKGNWKAKIKIVEDTDVTKTVNILKAKCCCDEKWVNVDSSNLLTDIIFDEDFEIILPKTEPIEGEQTWHVSASGVIYGSEYEQHKTDHKAMFLIGNCFKTEKEARDNTEKMVKILNSINPLIDLNEIE